MGTASGFATCTALQSGRPNPSNETWMLSPSSSLMPSPKRPRPQLTPVTGNFHLHCYGGKLRIQYELGAQRARAQLRSSQIEIVLFFEAMVRELVATGHAKAMRRSIRANQVDAGNLRL